MSDSSPPAIEAGHPETVGARMIKFLSEPWWTGAGVIIAAFLAVLTMIQAYLLSLSSGASSASTGMLLGTFLMSLVTMILTLQARRLSRTRTRNLGPQGIARAARQGRTLPPAVGVPQTHLLRFYGVGSEGHFLELIDVVGAIPGITVVRRVSFDARTETAVCEMDVVGDWNAENRWRATLENLPGGATMNVLS